MVGLITIAFLDDILCERTQIAAVTRSQRDYGVDFEQGIHLWEDSDYVVANLETPLAGWSSLGVKSEDRWLRWHVNLTGIKEYAFCPEDVFFARIECIMSAEIQDEWTSIR